MLLSLTYFLGTCEVYIENVLGKRKIQEKNETLISATLPCSHAEYMK